MSAWNPRPTAISSAPPTGSPRSARLYANPARSIEPVAKRVGAEDGERISYDRLVIACGLELDLGAIASFPEALERPGRWRRLRLSGHRRSVARRSAGGRGGEGGRLLFTRAESEMKGAWAPLKHAFLAEDAAVWSGRRGAVEIAYVMPQPVLFSVPILVKRGQMIFSERRIQAQARRRLMMGDPARGRAVFEGLEGRKEAAFSLVVAAPPMRAPKVVRESGLSWRDGPWQDQGWVEVDRGTLRHPRFPDVWAVGDVAGVPKGKTAASAKRQAPVMAEAIAADLAGRASPRRSGGYTSCPLITRVGLAMLVELYENGLAPSFPGVVPPLEELWTTWAMKVLALRATCAAMLRGALQPCRRSVPPRPGRSRRRSWADGRPGRRRPSKRCWRCGCSGSSCRSGACAGAGWGGSRPSSVPSVRGLDAGRPCLGHRRAPAGAGGGRHGSPGRGRARAWRCGRRAPAGAAALRLEARLGRRQPTPSGPEGGSIVS